MFKRSEISVNNNASQSQPKTNTSLSEPSASVTPLQETVDGTGLEVTPRYKDEANEMPHRENLCRGKSGPEPSRNPPPPWWSSQFPGDNSAQFLSS